METSTSSSSNNTNSDDLSKSSSSSIDYSKKPSYVYVLSSIHGSEKDNIPFNDVGYDIPSKFIEKMDLAGRKNTREHDPDIVVGEIISTPIGPSGTKYMLSKINVNTAQGRLVYDEIEDGSLSETSISHKYIKSGNKEIIIPFEVAYTEKGARTNCKILAMTQIPNNNRFEKKKNLLSSTSTLIEKENEDLKNKFYIQETSFSFDKFSNKNILLDNNNQQQEHLSKSNSEINSQITNMNNQTTTTNTPPAVSNTTTTAPPPSTPLNTVPLNTPTPLSNSQHPEAALKPTTTPAPPPQKTDDPNFDLNAQEEQLFAKLSEVRKLKNLGKEQAVSSSNGFILNKDNLAKLPSEDIVKLALQLQDQLEQQKPLADNFRKSVQDQYNQSITQLLDTVKLTSSKEEYDSLAKDLRENIENKSLAELEKDNKIYKTIATCSAKLHMSNNNSGLHPNSSSKQQQSSTPPSSPQVPFYHPSQNSTQQQPISTMSDYDKMSALINEKFRTNSMNNNFSQPRFLGNENQNKKQKLDDGNVFSRPAIPSNIQQAPQTTTTTQQQPQQPNPQKYQENLQNKFGLPFEVIQQHAQRAGISLNNNK